jgi:hypothetical protein
MNPLVFSSRRRDRKNKSSAYRLVMSLFICIVLFWTIPAYSQSGSEGEITGDKTIVQFNELFTLTITDVDLDADTDADEEYIAKWESPAMSNKTELAPGEAALEIRVNDEIFELNGTIMMNFHETGANTGVFVVDMNLSDIDTAVPGGLDNGDIIDFVYIDEMPDTESIWSVTVGYSLRSTVLQLDPIVSVVNNTRFTVSGRLFDAANGTELAGRSITFTGNGSLDLPDVTTQGVIFLDESGLQVISCDSTQPQSIEDNPGWESDPSFEWLRTPEIDDDWDHMPDCVPDDSDPVATGINDNKVLRMHEGSRIILPSGTNAVTIVLQKMGASTISVEVVEANTPATTFTKSSEGYCPDASNFILYSGNGISEIRVNDIVEAADLPRPGCEPFADTVGLGPTAGISSLITHDWSGNPQMQRVIDFEELPVGTLGNRLELASGSFFSTGVSPNEPSVTETEFSPVAVEAHFDGDSVYRKADAVGEYFVFSPTSQPGLGGYGEPTGGIAPDSGTGITVITCSVDSDNDGLCNTWEATGPTSGIPYIDGGQQYYRLTSITTDNGNPSSTSDDIYVEIDAMEGHEPLWDAVTDVRTSFASKSIKMHLVPQAEMQVVTHYPDLNVWIDNTPGVLDDFYSIKKENFGNIAEVNEAGDLLSGASSPKLKARSMAVHYGLFADSIGPCGPSGVAELPGNDFVVSLGCGFTGPNGSRQEQAGTMMHELGHNLNLDHGGPRYLQQSGFPAVPSVDYLMNCKANYPSVMTYSRQFPVFYENPNWNPGNEQWSLTYSGTAFPMLKENDLDENPTGLNAVPSNSIVYDNGLAVVVTHVPDNTINWDGDTPEVVDHSAVVNLNDFDITGCNVASSTEQEKGYNDWPNLEFKFTRFLSSIDGVYERPEDLLSREAGNNTLIQMQTIPEFNSVGVAVFASATIAVVLLTMVYGTGRFGPGRNLRS